MRLSVNTIATLELTPRADANEEIYACRATNPLIEQAVSDPATLDVTCKYFLFHHFLFVTSCLSLLYNAITNPLVKVVKMVILGISFYVLL